MKAMILAAGRGTRLLPLTGSQPKALVPLNGKPLLFHVLSRLQAAGFREVVINVHHHAAKLIQYIASQPVPGLELSISDESGQLLDTGGALLHAAPLLEGGGDILVHNVDVLTDLSLTDLLDDHQRSDALVTLAVRDRQSGRYLLFNDRGQLVGWKDVRQEKSLWSDGPVEEVSALAFSGVQVISERLLELLPRRQRFAIIPEYISLARQHTLRSFIHNAGLWMDLGRPEDLRQAESYLQSDTGAEWYSKYLLGWNPS